MRFYVAGPMKGKPQWNFPAFDRASALLRAYGHEVTSPADLDRKAGFDPDTLTEADVTPEFIAQAAKQDVWAIQMADAVYFLDGWEYSAGATAEHALARWLGKKLIYEIGPHVIPFAEINHGFRNDVLVTNAA